MPNLTELAKLLAGGGAVAVILILLVVIAALLRKWVRIPDDNYVPREQYDFVVKSEQAWKAIATELTPTVKEQADQLGQLTEILLRRER